MLVYRKERINNAILFFADMHYKKTHKYISQTLLYKYLAFFEFRHLKHHGSMPLELCYKAMEHGPVPVEIYNNKDNQEYFPTVTFEQTVNAGRIIKPKGKFNPDYFSDNEVKEMEDLIAMFAQGWVTASTASEASHQAIKAWQKTYKQSPNAVIDPLDEFDRDIENLPEDELTAVEERYLMRRKVSELSN
jgi:uncharacterized phage-associated protein